MLAASSATSPPSSVRTLAGSRHSLSRLIVSGRPPWAGCGLGFLAGFAAFSVVSFAFAGFFPPAAFVVAGFVLVVVVVVFVCMASISCLGLMGVV